MPMTKSDRKTLAAMQAQHGAKRGKAIFYASATKGTLGCAAKRRHGTKRGKK